MSMARPCLTAQLQNIAILEFGFKPVNYLRITYQFGHVRASTAVLRAFMSEPLDCRSGDVLIGNSQAIRRIYDQLQKASLTEVPVLITGESGTGKELAAKLLHNLSERRAYGFLKLSCAAMSSRFFDWELEHASDVLPGPQKSESAAIDSPISGGTLFLDEIDELDLMLQGKLLHKLQDSHLPGFNGANEKAENVRLICATNRDLEAEIAKGTFRTDLYYRINVLRIHMPSIRDRVTDIPLLMTHFIKVYSQRFGKDSIPLSDSFAKALETHHWPGNIRELENMAKRYVILGDEQHILNMMRQPELKGPPSEELDLTTPLRVQTKRAVQHLESKIILSVLKAHNWNRRKTARSLDISYRTLLYKIKEGGLPRSSNHTQS